MERGPIKSRPDTSYREHEQRSKSDSRIKKDVTITANIWTQRSSTGLYGFAWRTQIACTHGSKCLQCACHTSPSHPLHSHVPSASLLFPHDHFDTSFPSAPSLPNCPPIRKRGSSTLPHERRPGRCHALHTVSLDLEERARVRQRGHVLDVTRVCKANSRHFFGLVGVVMQPICTVLSRFAVDLPPRFPPLGIVFHPAVL